MKTPQPAPTEAELQAWVDGVLAPDRRDAVAAYLDLHPAEATRLQAYRTQNVALRALFNPVLDETLPPPLATPPRRRHWPALLPAWPMQPTLRYAAVLLLSLGSGALGWALHGQSDRNAATSSALAQAAATQDEDALAHRAAVAYAVYSPEVRHPVEVGADQEAHLVAWLSKRLGTQLRPPQLGRLGYELVGGRLLPGQSGPVAQFMYHDASGQRLTLYVSAEQGQNKDTGFRFAQEGQVSVFYWIDGKFGYALSAGIGKDALGKVADAVYEQLAPAS